MKRTARKSPESLQPGPLAATPVEPAPPPEPGRQDFSSSRAACAWGVWSGGAHPGERRRYPRAITGGTDYVD